MNSDSAYRRANSNEKLSKGIDAGNYTTRYIVITSSCKYSHIFPIKLAKRSCNVLYFIV